MVRVISLMTTIRMWMLAPVLLFQPYASVTLRAQVRQAQWVRPLQAPMDNSLLILMVAILMSPIHLLRTHLMREIQFMIILTTPYRMALPLIPQRLPSQLQVWTTTLPQWTIMTLQQKASLVLVMLVPATILIVMIPTLTTPLLRSSPQSD